MNISEGSISHSGFISHCYDDKAVVSLSEVAECDGCHIRDFCGKGDADRNTFVVNNQGLKVGDKVIIWLNTSTGMKAIFWAYLLPFLLLMTTLITCLSLGIEERLSGLFSLIVLLPYFIIIYLIKEKMNRHLQLKVMKQ